MRFTMFLVLAALLLVTQPSTQAGQWFSGKARAQGDAFYQSAFAAYDSGDYVKAHELLNSAEKLKPDQADGWNLRGAIFLKQKIYDKAEAAFGRAIRLDPALWAAQFNYAEVAFQNKNYPVARTRFDRLGSQTDRFKQKNQWELVQYKAFLSSLLMNDEVGAQKRLAKLPPTGGGTPAYAYAQAAIAFRHKDAYGAQKSLAAAQTAYTPVLNGLFTDSLVTLGWQAAPLPAIPAGAYAAAGPLSNGAPQPGFVIDPKIEAAAAEPLPAPDVSNAGAGRTPVLAPPSVHTLPSEPMMPMSAIVQPVASPTPIGDSAIERGILLD